MIPNSESPKDAAFRYQLDFLKLEYQSLNETIARIDGTTQTIKNWTLLIWAGSISFSLTREQDLRDYVIFTAIIPLVFWSLDAWWRRVQRQCIFRIELISDFLNSENLFTSFSEKKLINFHLIDHRARKYANKKELIAFSSVWKTVWFGSVAAFYLGLSIMSIGLGVFFLLVQ